MSFPSSPSNNQTAVVNGITYVYNASKTVWTRQQTNALTSTTSSNPPANATVGDTWYDTLSDVIYRYTNDGTGSYWVDITTPTVSVNTATSTASSGPKITSVVIANSAYISTGVYAVPLAGGYILVNGSGFESVPQVTIGTQPATTIGFVSSSQLQVQVPAQSGGTYPIYVTNSDGSVAINVPGLTYNQLPVWSTGSTLTSGVQGVAISIQLAATDDGSVTYAVSSGSSLPSGLSLSSGGLLSGTVTGLSVNTTYNFSINAIDSYTQLVTQAFSITISVGDTYFPYTTLLLNGDGTANSNNNIIVDSSNNNFAITRSGSVTQGTFTPFPTTGTWSCYLDYTTDAGLTTSYSGSASGDFTAEGFFFITQRSDNTGLMLGSSNLGVIMLQSGGKLSSYFTDTSFIVWQDSALVLNTWHHIVVQRASGTLSAYLNGTRLGTQSGSSQGWTYSSLTGGLIGKNGSNTGGGYWSNCRISTVARYSGNTITVPVTPFTSDANTTFLIAASNRFIDSSTNSRNITTNGTISVRKINPFGNNGSPYSNNTNSGSMYFNGTTDYVTTPSNTSFALGSSNFTIEFWMNIGSFPGNSSRIYANATGSDWAANKWTLHCNHPSNVGKLSFWDYNYSSSSMLLTGTTTLSFNAWHHVAIVRNSNSFAMYLDGNLEGTNTYSGSMDSGATISQIGGNVSAEWYNGYISNFRLTNGSALYTSAFTPSTTPFTNVANTSLLISGTNAGIIDGTMQNNLITVGDAKISTAQSKFGGSSMYFDGTGDYLFIPNTHTFFFRDKDFTIELWAYISETSTRKYILGPGTDDASHYKGFGLEIFNQQLCMWASSDGSSWNMLECDTAGNKGSTLLSINTWYHIAVTRSGNTFKSFINGVVEKTFTVSGTIYSDVTIPYNIGRSGYSSGGYFHYNGYMDDLRVTRGVARYTSNFTPPSALPPL